MRLMNKTLEQCYWLVNLHDVAEIPRKIFVVIVVVVFAVFVVVVTVVVTASAAAGAVAVVVVVADVECGGVVVDTLCWCWKSKYCCFFPNYY